MSELKKLKQSKYDFINYYDEKFKEEKVGGLREDSRENIESDYIKEKVRIERENAKVDKFNKKLKIICTIFLPVLVVSSLLYISFKYCYSAYPLLGMYFSVFVILFSFYLETLLMKNYNEIDSQKLYKIVNIEEMKIKYLNTLKCSISEMKEFYQPLVEHFGEEELNKMMTIEIRDDEDIGSYNFMLRLFEKAIADQEEKNKYVELKEKLNNVLN